MTKFVIGLILGLLIVPIGGFLYFWSGSAPVATAAPSMPFEKTMAKMALSARIKREAPATVPLQADEPTLLAGAKVYQAQCAVCHGLPGAPRSFVAQGMFPKPPELFHGNGVTDDPPGESYWKVSNGIRLTGMPGYGKNLSTDEMWQVTLLLANADKLPASVQAALAAK
jgi:thiosulfate dehydrogenase